VVNTPGACANVYVVDKCAEHDIYCTYSRIRKEAGYKHMTETKPTYDTGQAQKPRKNWGGARKGAGRKPFSPGGRRKARTFIATDEEWQQIVEKSIQAGCANPSEYIRTRTLAT
jgi:hypothetical protein